MGLMTLALTSMVTLIRRPELPSKSLPDSRDIEIAALKDIVGTLEDRLRVVQKDIGYWQECADHWRHRAESEISRRVHTEAHLIRQQANQPLQQVQYSEEAREQMIRAMQAQNFYDYPGQYQGSLGQYQGSLFGQQSQAQAQWGDCTCVPGRSDVLRQGGGE